MSKIKTAITIVAWGVIFGLGISQVIIDPPFVQAQGSTMQPAPDSTTSQRSVKILNPTDVLTITASDGPFLVMTLTEDLTNLTLNSSTWNINQVGILSIDVYTAGYAFGIDTNVVTSGWADLVDSVHGTNVNNYILFKSSGVDTWTIK